MCTRAVYYSPKIIRKVTLKLFQRSCAQGLCHGVSGEWRGCAEDRDCQDDLEGGSNFCANKRIAKIAYYHALHIMHRLMKWSLNYLVCSNFNQEISSWPALQQALNHSQSSPRSSFAGDGSLILSYPLILSNLIHSCRHWLFSIFTQILFVQELEVFSQTTRLNVWWQACPLAGNPWCCWCWHWWSWYLLMLILMLTGLPPFRWSI